MPTGSRPWGVDQSKAAGLWLKRRRFVPGVVLVTATQRTKQTANTLVEALDEDVPIVVGRPHSGWRKKKDPEEARAIIDARLREWLLHRDVPVQSLLFVGHCKSHECLVGVVAQGNAELEQHNNGAVIACNRVDGQWELEDWFPGGEGASGRP